jgi:hypothetical protein
VVEVTMSAEHELHDRRARTTEDWTAFVENGEHASRVRPEILDSWRRSTPALTAATHAPLADEDDTRAFWRDSPLQVAVERVSDDLRRTAEDGDLVVAVTDEQTRILWTCGGRVMRRKAETVNFVAGGRWDESSIGVNALNLAGALDRPATVFGAEHYAPLVHGWVCWAAPVHDPVSGRQLGVIDLSTTWERAHPIGLATARVMARLIETALPRGVPSLPEPVPTGRPGLVLTLLGRAQSLLDGRRLLLNRRQTEILALLAMAPAGLSLERLHADLYGDERVTSSTLKAEVSHLRAALGGRLSSRPYRLEMEVSTDVDEVLAMLRSGDVRGAVQQYGGDLLPGTNSPRLTEVAGYVAVAVREALLADPEPDAVIRYAEQAPYDVEVLEAALSALGDRAHPTKALLRGKLAAALG